MSTYFSRGPRRNHAQYLQPAAPRRISTSAGRRLDTIVEGDGANANPSLLRGATNRHTTDRASQGPTSSIRGPLQNPPLSRRYNHGEPPRATDEKPPPSYRSQPSEPSASDDPSNLKTWFASRGGWRRLALLVLSIILAIAIALGVGLGVGLKRSKESTVPVASGTGTPSPNSQPSAPFPLGTWNLPVALTDKSTDCTSSSETWQCFPYQTYSQSQAASLYTFNWVISTTSDRAGNDTLQVASSPNPFGLVFPQTRFILLDVGGPNERYTFSLSLPKQGTSIQNGARTDCYFNQTELLGSLYTNPQQSLAPPATGSTWPGTVYVEQSSPGGQNVPDCYPVDANNNVNGPRLTQGLQTPSADTRCNCIWNSVNETSGGTG